MKINTHTRVLQLFKIFCKQDDRRQIITIKYMGEEWEMKSVLLDTLLCSARFHLFYSSLLFTSVPYQPHIHTALATCSVRHYTAVATAYIHLCKAMLVSTQLLQLKLKHVVQQNVLICVKFLQTSKHRNLPKAQQCMCLLESLFLL